MPKLTVKSLLNRVKSLLLKRGPKLVPMPKLKKLKKRGYSVQCQLCDHRIPVTRKDAVLGIQGSCGCHGTFRGLTRKIKRDRQGKKQIKLIRKQLKKLREEELR